MSSNKRLPARFFQLENGNEPVRKWLLGLDPTERRLIGNDIMTAEPGEIENERFAMTDVMEKGRVGSSFEDFLKDQGAYETTVDQAVKRVLAF